MIGLIRSHSLVNCLYEVLKEQSKRIVQACAILFLCSDLYMIIPAFRKAPDSGFILPVAGGEGFALLLQVVDMMILGVLSVGPGLL